jgi:hypothetical protein
MPQKMGRMELTLTGTPDTLRKIQAFLALMHFNAGHSGMFAMRFDGDGHERLKVEPPPDDSFRLLVHAIGGVGRGPEIAGDGYYECPGNGCRYLADATGLSVVGSIPPSPGEQTHLYRLEDGKMVKVEEKKPASPARGAGDG